MSAIYPSGNLEVDESSLLALFPFFVIIDGNFRVSRLGNHMKSCIHGARVGAHIAEFIKLRLPLVTSSIDDWKWSSLQNCLSDQVAADCIYSNGLTNVRLAGRLTLFKSESELAKTALTCQPSTDEQPPSSSNSSLRQEAFRGALFLLQPVVPLQKELSLIPNYLLGSAGSDDKSGRDFVDKDNDLLLLLLGKLEQLESRNTEMKRQLDEARKSLEMKSMFVRYVSHEIRTPLNTVAMGLKLMQDCGTLSAINESDDATSLAIAKFGEHVRRGSSSFRMIDASGVSSPAARTPYTQSSRRGMAADIKESCDIAIDIVNDLLLYEKLEGGLLQLEKRKEPALSTIIEAVKTLEIQAKQVGIDLQFTFCSDDFPMEELDTPTVSMDVDRPKICQVLRNIVSNAIKFSPTGSVVSVHVELSEDTSGPATPKEAEVSSSCATVGTTVAAISSSQSPDGQKTVPAETAGKIGKELEKSLSSSSMLQKKRFMKVAVKDSGVGISPENQKKLFNSIVQFDPNRLQAGGGSGLGLYISKGIMDLHGGTIGLFSAGEGHGTTFFIELPVEQGARMEKSSSPEMYYDPKSSFFSATHEVQGGGKPVEESGRISVVPLRRVLRSGKGTAAAERSSTPEHVVSVSLRKYGEERRKSAASVSSLSERDEKSIMRRVPSTLNRVQNIRKEYMKILIVDDSRMNRRMTARYLSGRGFCTRRHPDEVSDGQQALESVMKAGASGEPYAAVLIDCMMPVMDGPTAVKKMREGGYKGLVVGVTGNVNQDEVDHFTSHGADMVMSKPLDLDLLTDVLKQITGARESVSSIDLDGAHGVRAMLDGDMDGDGNVGANGRGNKNSVVPAAGSSSSSKKNPIYRKNTASKQEDEIFSFRTNSSKAMTSPSFRSNAPSVPYSRQPLGVVPESPAMEAPSPVPQSEPRHLNNNPSSSSAKASGKRSAVRRFVDTILGRSQASGSDSSPSSGILGLFNWRRHTNKQITPQSSTGALQPPGRGPNAQAPNAGAVERQTAHTVEKFKNPGNSSAAATARIISPHLGTSSDFNVNSARSGASTVMGHHPQRVWSRSAASYRQAGAGSTRVQQTSIHLQPQVR